MRIFLSLLIFFGSIFGADQAFKTIQTKANAMSVSFLNEHLYIATYDGSIEIYDVKNDIFKQSIIFDNVKNITGEVLRPNILSIDELDGKLLVLTEDDENKRALYLVKNGEKKLVKKLDESAKKALFLDNNRAVIGTISNEISIINLQNLQVEDSFKISIALLADMRLNPDRSTLLIATEGGKIYHYNVGTKTMQNVVDVHKDTMYSIDYNGKVVVTAGVDMSIAILRQNGEIGRVKAKTSVMNVALSQNGTTGAYIEDDLSEIFIFDVLKSEFVKSIKTPQNTINSIVFVDDKTIVSAAFEKNLYFWKVR